MKLIIATGNSVGYTLQPVNRAENTRPEVNTHIGAIALMGVMGTLARLLTIQHHGYTLFRNILRQRDKRDLHRSRCHHHTTSGIPHSIPNYKANQPDQKWKKEIDPIG